REERLKRILSNTNQSELLDAASPIRLRHIEVGLRVKGDRVAVDEVADLVSGSAEARENLSAGMIEYMHLFVTAVHDVQNFLPGIPRKGDPPDRAPGIGKSG